MLAVPEPVSDALEASQSDGLIAQHGLDHLHNMDHTALKRHRFNVQHTH